MVLVLGLYVKMIVKRNLGIVGVFLVFGFQGSLVWVVFCPFCVFAKQLVGILAVALGVILSGRRFRCCIGLFVVPNLLFQ